jgi:hypothetical protein
MPLFCLPLPDPPGLLPHRTIIEDIRHARIVERYRLRLKFAVDFSPSTSTFFAAAARLRFFFP